MAGAGDLVVDHSGNLEGCGLPWSLGRGLLHASSVGKVSHLNFLLVGSVLFVVPSLGVLFRLLVSSPGLLVVRGLGCAGNLREFGSYFPVEH